MMRKTIILLATGILALTPGVAQAAPGHVSLCNISPPGIAISVKVQPGHDVRLPAGKCIGEGTLFYPFTEPHGFWVPGGWTAYWRINNGGVQVTPSDIGIFQDIYPGEKYSKNWRVTVDLRTFR